MGRRKTVVHKHTMNYDASVHRAADSLDEAVLRRYAANIITQAVEDWVYLIRLEDLDSIGVDPKRRANYKQGRVGNSNYIEIRAFLRGEWGTMLCDLIGIDPDAILQKLDDWLREYRNTGAIPKYIFQRE